MERGPITCPHCGHTQLEPLEVISTVCRQCRGAIRVRDHAGGAWVLPRSLGSLAKDQPAVEKRELECFECGARLTAPVTAESTMCKRCSCHIDLRDYTINQAVSKNFRTHGRFVVREKGYVFNTDCLVGEAVLRGRFHGRLRARRRLEIHSGAEIKGSIEAGLLVIPGGEVFGWERPIQAVDAEILGELSGELHATGQVWVRAGGRLFGIVEARALVVEAGAVLVADVQIGPGAVAASPGDGGV